MPTATAKSAGPPLGVCVAQLIRTLVVWGVIALMAGGRAEARIVGLTIMQTESPTFDGTAFGDVGTYEKLVGIATGEVDPEDPANAPIVDLALAPRNARGMVEIGRAHV